MLKKVENKTAAYFLLSFIIPLVVAVQGQTIKTEDPQLQRIDVEENLGGRIPGDIVFTDESGDTVELGSFFVNDGRPVILTLAYYECPMLCTMVLNGLKKAVHESGWQPGENFRMLTISIDPLETAELALGKQKTYTAGFEPPISPEDWKFLVGDQENITRIADALGIKYFYDESREEFAHPAVLMVLTPEGEISRYIYGISFNPRDIRLSLIDAADGNIGTAMDKFILYCFHYDPAKGGYVLMAANVMKIGGLVTLVILALFLGILWARDRHKKQSLIN